MQTLRHWIGAVVLLGLLAGSSLPAAATTVLVTGANRGIGLEYARQYAAKGYTVIATARKPSEATELTALAAQNKNVKIETLDVMDLAAIDALAAKYKGTAIDVLVNNAGFTGFPEKQRFGQIDYASFNDVMDTNVRGPLKITEAFFENIVASPTKKVVVVTSSEASIAGVDSNRQPFYRASKSAVNMAMKNVAFTVKAKGVNIVLVNPGPVDTDMMKSVRGRMPLRTPTQAVTDMIAVTDKATLEQTGTFWNYDGTVIPW